MTMLCLYCQRAGRRLTPVEHLDAAAHVRHVRRTKHRRKWRNNR